METEMSLSEKLSRIEKSHRLLQDEIQQARHEAELLEEENRILRRQLAQVAHVDYQRVTENGARIQKIARENLKKIYLDGFHICTSFFGEDREDECLFCLGVLGG